MKVKLKMLPPSLLFLASGLVFGCGSSPTHQSAQTSTAQLPQTPSVFLLAAKITKTTSDLKSVIFSHANPEMPGLSSAFYLDASSTDVQYPGLVVSQPSDDFTVVAQTTDGQLIACQQAYKQSPRNKQPQTEALDLSLSYDCQGRSLQFNLNSQPFTASQYARILQERALLQGASIQLTHTQNPDHLLELTLREQTIVLSEKGDVMPTLLKKTFPAEELRSFIRGQRSINIPRCSTLSCAKEPAALTLKIEGDGQLMAGSDFRHSASDSLRVSSYNVENFWDDVANNSKAYDDFSAASSNWYSDNFAFKKARRIREAILAAGAPDVIGIQEVESAGNKSRSLETLKPLLASLGYSYFALGQQAEDNPTAVTTAFISKYPLIENTRIDFRYEPSSLAENEKADFISASRDPQRVTVALPEGVALTLLNSHWKSKRDKSPQSDDMRRAMGQLLRAHVEALREKSQQDLKLIVLGDFNADYREPTVREGLKLSPSLSAARIQNGSLLNLWQTRTAAKQGSYPHDSELMAIDNMVVTQALLSRSSLVVNSELRVIGEFGLARAVLLNGDNLPLRSQLHQIKNGNGQLQTFHKDVGFSDHLPLVVELKRSLNRSQSIAARLFDSTIEGQSTLSLPYAPIPNSECSNAETLSVDSKSLSEHLLAAQRGDCVLINSRLTLRQSGLFNVAFDLPETLSTGQDAAIKASERIVIISADRGFGSNKNWLRNTLQRSAGKTVTRLHGRVGVINGVKAIFISEPSRDLIFE
jgi:endonuclease/exonuclease/phosphatase family metal-dependent hydrolase